MSFMKTRTFFIHIFAFTNVKMMGSWPNCGIIFTIVVFADLGGDLGDIYSILLHLQLSRSSLFYYLSVCLIKGQGKVVFPTCFGSYFRNF